MGDFNIDFKKKFDVNYQRKDYFELFDSHLGELHLMQLVPFDTWSRMVGQVLKSSLLDHICVDNVKLIKNVKCKIMPFGDHMLILADLCMTRPVQKKSLKCDWKGYSKSSLCNNLGLVDWSYNTETVQDI